MQIPTKEQLDRLLQIVSNQKFHDAHDAIHALAKNNDLTKALVHEMASFHRPFDTLSAFGNGLTIGIAIGLAFAEENQSEVETHPDD